MASYAVQLQRLDSVPVCACAVFAPNHSHVRYSPHDRRFWRTIYFDALSPGRQKVVRG